MDFNFRVLLLYCSVTQVIRQQSSPRNLDRPLRLLLMVIYISTPFSPILRLDVLFLPLSCFRIKGHESTFGGKVLHASPYQKMVSSDAYG